MSQSTFWIVNERGTEGDPTQSGKERCLQDIVRGIDHIRTLGYGHVEINPAAELCFDVYCQQ